MSMYNSVGGASQVYNYEQSILSFSRFRFIPNTLSQVFHYFPHFLRFIYYNAFLEKPARFY